jgi:hypothetical protein
MNSLTILTRAKSRSISAENFSGEKGKGGMALEGTGKKCARDLGQGWKVSPSVNIAPGEVFTMAGIEGPGAITHILRDDIASVAYWYQTLPSKPLKVLPGRDDLTIN